jgi:PAS domain S-box-containing protein
MAIASKNARFRRSAAVPMAIKLAETHPGRGVPVRRASEWDQSSRLPEDQDAARLLHILESVSDFVGIVGSNNKYIYINPAGRALLGVGDAEDPGALRLPDLHPPTVSRCLENEALPDAVRNGTWVGESVLLTRTGREIAVSQVLIARRATDGHVESIAVVMRDIRKRKRREAALRHSEERFRLLVEMMNEGYALTDRHGVLVFVNDRFARILGYTPSDVIGHALLDFVEPFQRDSIAKSFQQCTDEEFIGREAAVVHADGNQVSARLRLRRVDAAEVGSAGFCMIITDIAAETKLAEALRESQQELRCLSSEVLAAEENERKRIAAELHDGLGQSLGALKFGMEDAISSLEGDAIDDARGTLKALVPRVREALDEVRRMAMNLRPATLDDLGIVATLSWFVRDFRTIYRTIDVDADLRIVEADVPDALKVTMFRIVQEALNNVARHSRATLVRLSAEKSDDVLRLDIDDNGVGFDPNEVASRRSFDRRHGYAGMHDRILFSGGTLAIETAPGKGVRLQMSWRCPGTIECGEGEPAGLRRIGTWSNDAADSRVAKVHRLSR